MTPPSLTKFLEILTGHFSIVPAAVITSLIVSIKFLVDLKQTIMPFINILQACNPNIESKDLIIVQSKGSYKKFVTHPIS